MPPAEVETGLRTAGYHFIAGVDEAGRGSLAGPVVAAAVMLPPTCVIKGVDDSKALSAQQRERLDLAIKSEAVAVGFGVVQEEVIDALNILQATMLAMRRAIAALNPPPGFVLIDGDQSPRCSIPHRLIPSGDRLCFSISAASILAKVARDRIMQAYDLALPHYGFGRHKGYGTSEHLSAIARLGVSPIHRKTFKGVREYV
ncbi:MAG: ribonuclease HII [candidate division NC10 bacterium]|nr:ribonuclease HII [candidate division NC10 bacterium]MDE2322427.1 ribonuclease HII [candidate division NC10 bacterium]